MTVSQDDAARVEPFRDVIVSLQLCLEVLICLHLVVAFHVFDGAQRPFMEKKSPRIQNRDEVLADSELIPCIGGLPTIFRNEYEDVHIGVLV